MRFRRTAAALALGLSISLLAVGCSGDDDGATPDTELIDSQTTTVEPDGTEPGDTETTVAETTTTLPEPTGATSPSDAAMALYNSWQGDDRLSAAAVADAEVVEELWPLPKGPYELYRLCDDGEFGTSGCLFRDRSTGHTIQINLERRGEVWVISGIFFSEE